MNVSLKKYIHYLTKDFLCNYGEKNNNPALKNKNSLKWSSQCCYNATKLFKFINFAVLFGSI